MMQVVFHNSNTDNTRGTVVTGGSLITIQGPTSGIKFILGAALKADVAATNVEPIRSAIKNTVVVVRCN